jgi:hypothetical protein
MSYFKNINIQASDSPSIDAFGRWRVSETFTQFDMKQLHDGLDLFIDKEIIGTGTYSHDAALAESVLSTSATNDVVVFQTKQRFNYQSGKSQLLFWTFYNMGIETNVTKRVGYYTSATASPFDSGLDGFFLESDSITGEESVNVYRNGILRSSIVRSSWDDPLDGSGRSGITHDFDDNTIMSVDFEWLGVGRLRWYVVKDGAFVKFHELDYTNDQSVYMSSPNQSMRWEIRQSGAGTGTMYVICSSVNSEGSINLLGKILSDNLGTDGVSANTVGTKYALLGLRLNGNKADTLVDILDFSVLSTTLDNQVVELWLNPTVAGTFTYNSVNNSSIQVAKGDVVTSPSTTTVTGGTLLFSRYISSQSATVVDVDNAIRLGMSIAGVSDTIVLTTSPLTSNSDVYGSISWRELS